MDVTREGGDPTSGGPAAAIAGSRQPPTSPISDQTSRSHYQRPVLSQQGDSNEQQRVQVEQIAQNVLENVLNDAFEAYLRRELQHTAEEAVREALAAVGHGDSGGSGGDPVHSSSSWRPSGAERPNDDIEFDGRKRSISHDLNDDEQQMSSQAGEDGDDEREDYEEEDEDEDTLTHSLRQQLAMAQTRSRGPSSSPSRGPPAAEGLGDFLQDLSEMSNLADRIDSILDQTASENSTRSGGRLRSHSPMPQIPFEQYDEAYEIQDEDEENQEVD